MKWKHSIYPEEGFTLLEIMIALIVMSIGIMALAGLQISAIRGNAFSKRMTTAVSIAQEKLEQIKSISYTNIQSESSTQINKSSINFNRQVTVTNNTNPANTKTVRVSVTWIQASKSYTVPISTLISQ